MEFIFFVDDPRLHEKGDNGQLASVHQGNYQPDYFYDSILR